MSWDVELYEKVKDRLDGDSTLTGLTTVFTEWQAEGQTMPYVVIQHDTAGTEDAFDAKGIYTTLEAHVFAEKKDPGSLSTVSLILNRIGGDWLTNGGSPSYGLERWQPELSAVGWTSGHLQETGPRVRAHEPGVWHYVSTFESLITKTVSGP